MRRIAPVALMLLIGLASITILLVLKVFDVVATEVPSCKAGPYDRSLAKNDAHYVNRFIGAVSDGGKADVAKLIKFPMTRRYPLPSVSRDEFLLRYEHIFDEAFVRMVTESGKDDCGRGWRGLFLHGVIGFDEEGMVRSVGYESASEEQERMRLVEEERTRLHISLREYDYPVLEWKTCTYLIRIDRTGLAEYRLASWSADRSHQDEPSVVAERGIVVAHGNMGGHTYIFPAGEFQYVLDRSLGVHDSLMIFNAGHLNEELESCAGSCWKVWGLLRKEIPLLAEVIVNKGNREQISSCRKLP